MLDVDTCGSVALTAVSQITLEMRYAILMRVNLSGAN